MFEDSAADFFIRALLKTSSKFVPDGFYFYCCGSNGQILTRLRNFQVPISGLKFIGVFDGDCRVSMKKDLQNVSYFTYLPSSSPPERLLIDMIGSMSASEVSSALACSEQRVRDALDNTAGADIHDYLFDFAKIVDMHINSLLPRLCDVWVSKNPKQTSEFLEDFERLLA